ncbi:unnamed protein product [Spirodela intermedia]|uniref:Uncharacterized protein n=2 Tax=Spirodela intermedia TaxID=51605 RepID=A0A7I8IDH9_SPIIN|nr:unnamed protein product [Spirodela intermedia]CAA6655816.1 unnamed protein product [Spirodela intermedia]CAA7391184.1 unnamed protein product [Spirodela intermedia]
MRIFGRYYVYPRQLVLAASGLLFLGATTYDVHRSIKNNERPPSEEQMRYLDDVLRSSGRPPPPMPAPPSDSR